CFCVHHASHPYTYTLSLHDALPISSQFHYEYAKLALEHGKNVLVEKPFAETSAEAKELFELAKQKDLFIQCYQNRRFDSDFLTRSEEHTSELQSRFDLVCRLLLEKK